MPQLKHVGDSCSLVLVANVNAMLTGLSRFRKDSTEMIMRVANRKTTRRRP